MEITGDTWLAGKSSINGAFRRENRRAILPLVGPMTVTTEVHYCKSTVSNP